MTGYNNGAYLMNDIYKTLYSRNAIEARSIRIENLDQYITEAGEQAKANYISSKMSSIGTHNNISNIDTTNNTVTYTNNETYYPMLYKQEKDNGIGRSDPYYTEDTLIKTEEIGVSHEKTDSLTLKYERYQISFNQENYGKAYDIFMEEGKYSYWIASRCTYLNTGYGGYGFYYGDSTNKRIYGHTTNYTHLYLLDPTCVLRPVVHLDADTQIQASETATDSSTPHIITKYSNDV